MAAALVPRERTLLRRLLVGRQKSGLTAGLVTGLRDPNKSDGGISAFLVTRKMRACTELFDSLGLEEQREAIAAIPVHHTVGELVQHELKRTGYPPRTKHRSKPGSHEEKVLRVIEDYPSLKGLGYCRKLDSLGIGTPTSWRKDGCPSTNVAAYQACPAPENPTDWKKRIRDEKSRLPQRRGV